MKRYISSSSIHSSVDTNDEAFISKLAKEMKLSAQETEIFKQDINNLRGDEWLDAMINSAVSAADITKYKQLINYNMDGYDFIDSNLFANVYEPLIDEVLDKRGIYLEPSSECMYFVNKDGSHPCVPYVEYCDTVADIAFNYPKPRAFQRGFIKEFNYMF